MVAAKTKIREKQQRTGRRSCGCFSSTRRRILLIGSFISFIIWSYTIMKIIQNLKHYFDNDERSTRRKDNNTDYTNTEYQLDAPTTPIIYSFNHNRNRINNDNDSRVVVETETNNKTKTTKTKTETKKMTDIQRYRIKQEQERLRQRRHQENASLLLIHDENDNNTASTADADADNTLAVLAPKRYASLFDFAIDDDKSTATATTTTATTTAAAAVVVVDLPSSSKKTSIKHISIVGISNISNNNNNKSRTVISASNNDVVTHTNHSKSHYSPRIVGIIDNAGYSFQHYKIVKKVSRLNEKKIKNNKQNKYWQEQEHPTHSQNIPRSHTEDIDQLQHQLYVNQQSNNYKEDCIYPNDDTADDQEATDFYAVYNRVRCSSNSNKRKSEDVDDNERSGSGSGSGDDNDDCERSGDSDDEDDEWSIIEQLDPSFNSKSKKTTSSYPYSSLSKSNNKERVWQKRNYPVCNTIHELGILGNEVGNTAMVNIEVLGKGSYRTAYLLDNIYPRGDDDDDNDDNNDDDKKRDDSDNVNDDSKIVIKMFGLDTDREFPFDIASFEMHRVDSVISQKMTASPYILDIYGHCGVSGLYEQGYDDLQHSAKNRRHRRDHHHHHTRTPELTLETKIRYSSEAIQAIYDLHTIDYDDDDEYSSSLPGSSSSSKTAVVDPIGRPATIIHGDIKPENFILVQLGKGKKKTFRLKLNDFNYSILRKFNRTAATAATSSTSTATATASSAGTRSGDSEKEQHIDTMAACPYYTNQVPLSWGVGYRPYEFSIDNYPPINENIDIFGLGGVLYYILEGKDPYWQYTKDHEVEEISKGLLPPISTTTTKRIVNSKTDTGDIDTRRTIKTIIDIIHKSMSLNVNDRPTSKQVLEQFLDEVSL